MSEEVIVLSVGGSLIFPQEKLDLVYLQNLNTFIRQQIKEGKRFILVSGGGKITRHYQQTAQKIHGSLLPWDIDWLGIHATRLNAHLLRTIFQDIAHPRIIENYSHKLENWNEPIALGAGWKPGRSTDYCAVKLALDYGATRIINLTNVFGIYDKDPQLHPDAKLNPSMTWKEVQAMVGTEWVPGSNVPFDPTAVQLSMDSNLKVIITKGTDFSNLSAALENKAFKGTIIEN